MKEKTTLKNAVLVIIAIIFFALSCVFAVKFYNKIVDVYNPTDILQLKEKNDISYLVYLKDSEFGEEFMEMNKHYVYSYTDYVKITSNYSNTLNEDLKVDYKYNVNVNLILREAKSTGGNNPQIMDEKKEILDEKDGKYNKSTIISDTYEIHLDEYKKTAEEFASTVDFPVSAEIRIDFETILNGESDRFKSEYIRSVTIPLSNEVYEIALSETNDKTSDFNVPNKNLFTVSFFANSILIILCYAIIFLAIKGIFIPKSKYIETINKYLKTYDDIIINTDSPLDFENHELLIINDFKELLELSYNTSIPIMFYESPNNGAFYINYNDTIYTHIVQKDNSL